MSACSSLPNEFLGGHIEALMEELKEKKATFGCTVEVDVQYGGGTKVPSQTLDDFEGHGSLECAILCAGSSSCQFWRFDSDIGNCELTSSEPISSSQSESATSGTRICGRSETFAQGTKYHFSKPLLISTAQVAF